MSKSPKFGEFGPLDMPNSLELRAWAEHTGRGPARRRMLTGSFPFRSDMFDDEAGENFVGSPKMSEIQHRLRSFKVDYDNPVFAEACDAGGWLVSRSV